MTERLPETTRAAIREELRADQLDQPSIARKLGVSRSSVQRVARTMRTAPEQFRVEEMTLEQRILALEEFAEQQTGVNATLIHRLRDTTAVLRSHISVEEYERWYRRNGGDGDDG